MLHALYGWTLLTFQAVAPLYMSALLWLNIPAIGVRVSDVIRDWRGVGPRDAGLLRRIARLVAGRMDIPATIDHLESTAYREDIADHASHLILEEARRGGLKPPLDGPAVVERVVSRWHQIVRADHNLGDAEREAALQVTRHVVAETVARYLEFVVNAGPLGRGDIIIAEEVGP